MKFFVVILAVIGIESIGNCAGQSTEASVSVTVNSILDTGSKILTAYHSSEGNKITFLKDVTQGDLTFFMELTLYDDVIVAADENDPHDFCEDSLQGAILRSTLLPEGETSCPVKKGDYSTPNGIDAKISNTEELTQMKCDEYEGVVVIREGADNSFFQMKFNLILWEGESKCKE